MNEDVPFSEIARPSVGSYVFRTHKLVAPEHPGHAREEDLAAIDKLRIEIERRVRKTLPLERVVVSERETLDDQGRIVYQVQLIVGTPGTLTPHNAEVLQEEFRRDPESVARRLLDRVAGNLN